MGTSPLDALVDELTTVMARTRGLAPLRRVERRVMTRPEILARLRERFHEEYPPGELEREATVLERLGMIPSARAYEATVFALLEEQVAGFYDPPLNRLALASWLPHEAQAMTLSHEVVHALQDQHFDIGRFTHRTRGGGDAQTAAMAVVEGDATLAMIEHPMQQQGRSLRDLPDPEGMLRSQTSDYSQQPRLRDAPLALRESLLFPYRDGLLLCLREYTRGGFAAIDAMLRTPPASTEQVLHADKLASREAPVAIAARVPRGFEQQYDVVYDDVMGELGAALFLRQGNSAEGAQEAAAGWGGDRAVLLAERSGRVDAAVSAEGTVLVWSLVFDRGTAGGDDSEAVAFERAATTTLTAHAGSRRQALAGAPPRALTIVRGDGTATVLARRGRAVVLVEHAPAARAGALASSALATTASASGR